MPDNKPALVDTGAATPARKDPVTSSPVAKDYARDAFVAGGPMAALPKHIKAAMVLLTRAYGLDPIAGDVIMMGNERRPVLYITAGAWQKKLIAMPQFNGYSVDRPATPEECAEFGFDPPAPGQNVVWLVHAARKDWEHPIVGIGQADLSNVSLQNMSKVTDHRILMRMAQKRAHHEAARKATAFMIDSNLWAAMDEPLKDAAKQIAVQVGDEVREMREEIAEAQDRAGDDSPMAGTPEPAALAAPAVTEDAVAPEPANSKALSIETCGSRCQPIVDFDGMVLGCTEDDGHGGPCKTDHGGVTWWWHPETGAMISRDSTHQGPPEPNPKACPECGLVDDHEPDCVIGLDGQ